MRLFEILFVAFISILLVDLYIKILKDENKKRYILSLLLVFIIHLIIEGYRWQMIPSYIIMGYLSFIYLLNKKNKKPFLIVQKAFLTFLFTLSIFLGTALPVLQFSNVNGDYDIGIQNYQLVDTNRKEILTKEPNDLRELAIRVYYPTPLNHNHKYSYIPNFEKIRHTYKKKLGWPSFLLNYLKLFTIDAKEEAPIHKNNQFPLVVYSHGLTNNYNEASGRLMKLASKGYVVVAINHTYSSDFAILSNGKLVGYKALSQLGDPIDKIDSVKTIIAKQWINDVKFVKNSLLEKPIGETIDFTSIGLMGFSAGGTMASLGSYELKDVKAAVNLDGTPRGINFDKKPNSPVLAIFSEPQIFTDAQIEAWGLTREAIDAPRKLINERSNTIFKSMPDQNYVLTIPKTQHSNFIEYPLISPLSNKLGIGGSINAKQCYESINEIVFAFLDKNLKGIRNNNIAEVIDKTIMQHH
ncbi:hypothetical protein D7030_04765 [Flavobacteriaceae bacterium AU392]|nr:hypothetical protein D1817_11240 [Flavobacteriaceae bacterium]RKM85987.1 hypothetical protein D7030_04765 [Flavobacteriaceae bacterium AU392]